MKSGLFPLFRNSCSDTWLRLRGTAALAAEMQQTERLYLWWDQRLLARLLFFILLTPEDHTDKHRFLL